MVLETFHNQFVSRLFEMPNLTRNISGIARNTALNGGIVCGEAWAMRDLWDSVRNCTLPVCQHKGHLDPQKGMTRYALQQDFYALSGANFFGAPKADWNMVFNSDGVANEVRSAQTYAISKGVHGTPTFFVQDTLVPEASSSWTMAQWVAYLAKI